MKFSAQWSIEREGKGGGEHGGDRRKDMNNFHIIIYVVYVLFVRMKANNMLPLIC
jgi:hypothetical protein